MRPDFDSPLVCDWCGYLPATAGCEACGLLVCATCQARVEAASHDPNNEGTHCPESGHLHTWGAVTPE